jgi:hypothetical protein
LVFESEIMKRDYRADSFFSPGVRLQEQTLKDWGLYAQLLWGFKKDWATGIRLDYASGSGTVLTSFCSQAFLRLSPIRSLRNNRYRLSPLLAWHPTEFSRFRLQYNYDHFSKRIIEFEGRDAHSVWLGVEFMLGAHAAHKY